MGLSIRAKNILTAVIALVLVGGFIFLAEGRKKDNKDDRLEAIEGLTTTTVRRTTTTREPTTTSSTALATTSTSSSPAVTTATTVRTTTTRASTTATTRRTTTTRAPAGPDSAPVPQNGARSEASDNGNSFTRNADGSFTTSAAPACDDKERVDPFCFHVGSQGSIALVVVLRNNTNRTLRFPTADGYLRLVINVARPNGTTQQFALDTTQLGKTIAPHEGVRISTSSPQDLAAQFSDQGQYTFTATCEVDYGS